MSFVDSPVMSFKKQETSSVENEDVAASLTKVGQQVVVCYESGCKLIL